MVAQIAMGDRDAFTVLAGRYLPAIEAFARRALGDAHRAQDVAQDVLLQLWLKAADFDPERARLTTWLHQMAYHRCIDQHRRDKRLTGIDDAPLEQAAGDTDENHAQIAIDSALRSLPERQRTALVLTYYQSLPNRDVAEIMGLSVRALESLLVRARAAVRNGLEG